MQILETYVSINYKFQGETFAYIKELPNEKVYQFTAGSSRTRTRTRVHSNC